ncbi:MAG: pentapeptide repeat-containing protein [Pseudomonadota bacterium]
MTAQSGGEVKRSTSGASVRALFASGYGIFLFGVGLGLGMFLAFSGQGFLFVRLSLVLTAFLIAAFLIGAVALLAVVFRRRLLAWLFDVTDTEISRLSAPIADFARSAVRRDEDGMVVAGRDLTEAVLARYTVVSGRRWMIGALTALVAALAALAGTTLLFRQNELIGEQALRLHEQNALLEEQTGWIAASIELSEAQRSAGVLPQIAAIAQDLAAETAALSAEGEEPPYALATQISPGLVERMVLASLTVRPYRYLAVADATRDHRAAMVEAATLRPDLPQFAAAVGAQPPGDGRPRLMAQPVSPERGLLIAALYNNGLRDLSWLAMRGADLSFAEIRKAEIFQTSFRYLTLSQAQFSGLTLIEADFGGATLYGARFAGSILRRSSFAAVPGRDVPPPMGPMPFALPSHPIGAEFSNAFLQEVRFDGASAYFARFRAAFLADVSFAGAALDAADFGGAVLLDVDFSGASLRSVEFDGALMVGDAPLERLATQAAPGSFRTERYVAEEVSLEAVFEIDAAGDHLDVEVPLDRLAGRTLFRLRRVEGFEGAVDP